MLRLAAFAATGGGRARQWPAGCSPEASSKGVAMLETIAVVLIVLWLLGMVSGYTISSFIHILLVIAVVLFLVRLLSGRRVA
jgi:hypothetical protein